MRTWLRRWLAIEPIGTLTLLDGDPWAILGLPAETGAAEAERVRKMMEEWMHAGKGVEGLQFPFPVTVIDQRSHTP